MKLLFFITLMFLVSSQLNAQIPKETSQPEFNTDWLKKSKRQKTVAFSLLGGGAGLVFISYGIASEHIRSGQYYSSYPVLSTITIAGVLCMLSSVPLFIASARNKGRISGLEIGLKAEPYQFIERGQIIHRPYQLLTLKIGI